MSAISKSVRNQYLEFLAETGMTRYEFSKRSGIPESTLWSLAQKEDYDVRFQTFLMPIVILYVLRKRAKYGLLRIIVNCQIDEKDA